MNRYSGYFLLAAGLSALMVCGAAAQWSQLNAPEPPVVSAIGSDGQTLLLGTNEADAGELFRSTDGGHTWSNAGFPNGGIGDLLVDGTNWYLGNYLDGIYRSSDGGFAWTQGA